MRLSLLLSLLIFSTILCSQNQFEITKIYKVNEGLSNDLVTRVKQDSRGFLWIGTFEGLNRFDGQEFEQYFHERKNQNSLPHA